MSHPHQLLDIAFVLAACCALVAQGMIVRAMLRLPRRLEGPGRVVVHRAAELAWTLLPAAGLAGVLALTWIVMHGGGR